MVNNAPAQKILTVSQLNQTVRRLLESEFSGIWLTGEVSNFVRPASGHWYFSLKDDSAQIRGAMFRGNNRACRVQPQDGMQVLVRARLSLYEPRGDYQIIVDQMEPAGDGLLKQQFEQLKNQLAAQGLFAQANKKPLPSVINRVGIITSSTGAAVKDIISVLKRRAPHLEVIIYPTQVQGDLATQKIASTIALADHRNEVDVLVVGRGGGSLEDLWCFNEELVARAIYQCRIPIVSAVGHEVDTTISDYVADVRAATPSAAAELVSPDSNALTQQITQYKQQLFSSLSRCLSDAKNTNLLLEQRLLRTHPQNVLNNHNQKVDELNLRINNAIKSKLQLIEASQNQITNRFKLAQTALNIPHKQSSCNYLAEQLNQLIQKKLLDSRHLLNSQSNQLDIISPLSTLQRGYSIARNQNQQVIKHTAQVSKDEMIETTVVDGVIKSRVI